MMTEQYKQEMLKALTHLQETLVSGRIDLVRTMLESLTANVAGLEVEGEDVGTCRFCGERGVGFADAEAPSDYCGHDPALIRKETPQ